MAGERYYLFCNDRLLLRKEDPELAPFSGSSWPGLHDEAKIILPLARNSGEYVVELRDDFDTEGRGLTPVSLRSLVGTVEDEKFDQWGKAAQLLTWWKTHRFCGQCGGTTSLEENEQAMVCPACSLSWYPRISPCVIVLVTRGEDLLLARSPRFRDGMYSTLAGFVEPGESLEATLRREIAEEVAIRIKNIRYFGSQPWPFPGQLMLGFFAEYHSGEIKIDGLEICDAGWYHCRSLPMIPGEGTIAGRMIRHYLESLH